MLPAGRNRQADFAIESLDGQCATKNGLGQAAYVSTEANLINKPDFDFRVHVVAIACENGAGCDLGCYPWPITPAPGAYTDIATQTGSQHSHVPEGLTLTRM